MEFLSENEVAKLLGVSLSFLRNDRWNNQHGIPYVKIGRFVRYQPHRIEEWINQQSSLKFKNIKIRRGRPTKAEQVAAGKI